METGQKRREKSAVAAKYSRREGGSVVYCTTYMQKREAAGYGAYYSR